MHENSVLGAMLGARKLRTHRGLFHWLQRDVKHLLPHDILVAAWGDFSSRRVSLDVVSALPGMRTTEPLCTALQPLLQTLFNLWVVAERAPVAQALDSAAFTIEAEGETRAFGEMRSAVAHGIKDERGGMDCLYIAFSRDAANAMASVEAMEVLLPYLDAAFRQVALLPMQRDEVMAGVAIDAEAAVTRIPGSTALRARGEVNLSNRELEIMHWVSIGKTNVEIAQILDISPRTVRNHLQNIFRKLDVMNRAQAVFEIEQLRAGGG